MNALQLRQHVLSSGHQLSPAPVPVALRAPFPPMGACKLKAQQGSTAQQHGCSCLSQDAGGASGAAPRFSTKRTTCEKFNWETVSFDHADLHADRLRHPPDLGIGATACEKLQPNADILKIQLKISKQYGNFAPYLAFLLNGRNLQCLRELL